MNAKKKEVKCDEIEFYYRGTNLSNKYIITSVKLKGKLKARNLIEKKEKK